MLKFWVFEREERTVLESSNTWEQNFGGKEILQKERRRAKKKEGKRKRKEMKGRKKKKNEKGRK